MESVFNNLQHAGRQPGISYGLCKVHKCSDGLSPPSWPILLGINTPFNKIATFYVPMLSKLIKNICLERFL